MGLHNLKQVDFASHTATAGPQWPPRVHCGPSWCVQCGPHSLCFCNPPLWCNGVRDTKLCDQFFYKI